MIRLFFARSGCFILLMALGLLSGCHVITRNAAPTFVPQSAYIPTLPGRRADGGLSVGLAGLDAQVAVAPTNGVALTAQGHAYRRDKGRDRFQAAEAGFGYRFVPTPHLHLSFFSGAGAGWGTSVGSRYETWYGLLGGGRYDSAERQATSSYTTVYLMPALSGSLPDGSVEIACAVKLYWLTYRELTYAEQTRRGGATSGGLTTLEEASSTEVTRRHVGLPRVQLAGQINAALAPHLWLQVRGGLDLIFHAPSRYYQALPVVGAVGLFYRFGSAPGL